MRISDCNIDGLKVKTFRTTKSGVDFINFDNFVGVDSREFFGQLKKERAEREKHKVEFLKDVVLAFSISIFIWVFLMLFFLVTIL